MLEVLQRETAEAEGRGWMCVDVDDVGHVLHQKGSLFVVLIFSLLFQSCFPETMHSAVIHCLIHRDLASIIALIKEQL